MSAQGMRRFHASATSLWILLIAPTILLWSNSIQWLALMSVWANIAAHFSAWQAARVEEKEDE